LKPTTGLNGRITSLWGLLFIQGFCAVFFLGDAITDLLGLERRFGPRADIVEFMVVIALILGLVLTALEIRRVLGRQKRIEQHLQVASGAFAELLEEHFETWSLTPSEREVALLAIKGMSISETAELRNTKEGTVKAQCNAIYRKAGVSGRTQLLSLFIEELLSDDGSLAAQE
jgi:DNA-binding CsgD family transcriptional regulator